MTHTVRVMGRRWKPLILYYLTPGPLRFNEIRRCIPEVTQKMLTQTLREMVKDGIINRRVYSQIPPKVVYSVSRYGLTLQPILVSLCAWGMKDRRRAGLADEAPES